jgi:beta-N-acetylhexosaminidase
MTHRSTLSSTLREACGQLLTVSLEGESPSSELQGCIARSEVGGVILFRPNIIDFAQVVNLVSALRASAPPPAPLLISVDQEGGRVRRLREPLPDWPAMQTVAAAGDATRTEAVGRAMGEEVAALGISWDLAPVLDVLTSSDNPSIGDRAFGANPEAASLHALSWWRGLRAAGVLGCGKHFPGHGGTHADSHTELPTVDKDIAALRAVDLRPFVTAIQAGIEAIMTAHVVYPALDPAQPATLSRRIVTDLLRGELGFQGVVVSDDLAMKAVADRGPIGEIVVQALEAGVDHLVMRVPAETQVEAFEALVRAGEAHAAMRDRICESAARVAALKQKAGVHGPASPECLAELVGSPQHRALASSFS